MAAAVSLTTSIDWSPTTRHSRDQQGKMNSSKENCPLGQPASVQTKMIPRRAEITKWLHRHDIKIKSNEIKNTQVESNTVPWQQALGTQLSQARESKGGIVKEITGELASNPDPSTTMNETIEHQQYLVLRRYRGECGSQSSSPRRHEKATSRHRLIPKDDLTDAKWQREEPGLTAAEAEQQGGMKPDGNETQPPSLDERLGHTAQSDTGLTSGNGLQRGLVRRLPWWRDDMRWDYANTDRWEDGWMDGEEDYGGKKVLEYIDGKVWKRSLLRKHMANTLKQKLQFYVTTCFNWHFFKWYFHVIT